MKRRLIVRRIVVWILICIVIFLTGFLTQLYARNTLVAISVTAGLGLADALLWPLLSYLNLPFTLFTFGLGAFVLNAALFWGAALLFPQIQVANWGLLLLPLFIAVINTAVSGILTFENDASFYHAVYRKTRGRARRAYANRDKLGIIFLEIDGLSESVLRQALENGSMPNLASWIKRGTHRLRGWETDFSSQTAASQAGILHGNNHNIPAFRWVEKAGGNKLVTPATWSGASLIESRISDGNGLLSGNGRAAVCLYSGDAHDPVFVYSKYKKMLELYRQSGTFSAGSYNFVHTSVHMLHEMFREFRSRLRQRQRNVQPRLERIGLLYYLIRAVAAGFFREVVTYTVVGDILAGDKDVIYSVFPAYDEIAHHCGVDDEESFYILGQLDKCIKRIEGAGAYSLRHYSICVLSDHGQTNGSTFLQRYGCTLAQLVEKFIPEDNRTFADLNSNQDHFGSMVSYPFDSIKQPLEKMNEPLRLKRVKKDAGKADVIVLASGNMGLVYFTRWPGRLTAGDIERAYPGLLEGLSRHEGIGFIMVRTDTGGSAAIGAEGTHYLTDGRIEGKDPLAIFGRNTAAHLRRLDSFACVPDIVVTSMYDPEKNEVASFEERIGSHGGVGGDQSKPFILHPAGWDIGEEEIVGAETLGKLFREKVGEVAGRGVKN